MMVFCRVYYTPLTTRTHSKSMVELPHSFVRIVLGVLVAFLADQIQRRVVALPAHLGGPRAKTYLQAVHSLLTIIIILSLGYFVFRELSIDVTPFFASAGIVGIIVGLGFRPLLEDFFTALFMFTQDTIRVGDYVQIGTSEGWVESLGFQMVTLRDRSGALHAFPNREVKKVINYSRRNAEIIVDVPVKYKGDIDKILPVFTQSLEQLYAQKDVGKYATHDSRISGIEEIRDSGTLVIRTILVTRITHRGAVSRRFRYLVLKQLEKNKLSVA